MNLAVALLLALHGLLPPSAHAALQDGCYRASTNCTVDVQAVVRGVVERHVSRLGDGGSGAISSSRVSRQLAAVDWTRSRLLWYRTRRPVSRV